MKNTLQHSFKYIAIYLSASLDIESAIELICKRMKHKKMLVIFRGIQNNIKQGKSITDSFAILRDRNLLDSISWAIFTSAERGGNIKDAFFAISQNIEESSKNRMSLVGALAYPVGMFLASLCMTVFLITVAFSKITPLFKSMNAPIPKTTLYLLNFSNFILDWGLYIFCIVVVSLCTAVYIYRRNNTFKYRAQYGLLHVPIFSKIILYREYASIASSIQVLLKNNITLTDSLKVAEETSSLIPLTYQFIQIQNHVQSGQKLSHAFLQQSFFSDEWVDLITVGEMTGRLADSFKDVSSLYQTRYKETIQLLVRVSEPAALLCTAIVVLIIALSVITPMYSIIQQVQQ